MCGLEEYLLGNHPLLQYRVSVGVCTHTAGYHVVILQYIRRALSKHVEPMLSLVPRSALNLETNFPLEKFVVPTAVYSKGRSQTKVRCK